MNCSPPGSSVHGILRPWDPPGKNNGLGCNFFFQDIFPIQGSNQHLLYCRQMLRHLMKTFPVCVSLVQFSSVAQSCLTLCKPIDCRTPASLFNVNSRSLLKLISIESVVPPNHLILCQPLVLLHSIFPSIRIFSTEWAV